MQVIEGRELRINCILLMGNPKPQIHWLKNGHKLIENNFTKVELKVIKKLKLIYKDRKR